MRLIYLSPVPWNTFPQRPQEFARFFHAQTGGEILWIDPYPTRLPVLHDLVRSRPVGAGAENSTPSWLHVLTPSALPIEPVPYSDSVNRLLWSKVIKAAENFAQGPTLLGIGKPSLLALELLSRLRGISSFYDAMDDFPAFYTGLSKIALSIREKRLVRQVSTVTASSSLLVQRMKQLSNDVRLVLNACAVDRLPVPGIVASSPPGRAPVIGYIGTIARWFDWDLVMKLANRYPESLIRLIGPVYIAAPKRLPMNIKIEPAMRHAQALETMREFDIGLIPFKRTPLTSSVDPIKYYEYRSMGLPVMSTCFGEMSRRGVRDGVHLIKDGGLENGLLEDAILNRPKESEIMEFRKLNSWQHRFGESRLVGTNQGLEISAI